MPVESDVQEAVNRRVYHATGVDRGYASWTTLARGEATVLLRYQRAFYGRDILDLGVGTGRTTLYLAPLADHYHAIDYSPVMVAHMRARMPRITVSQMDLSDLSVFPEESFDFVFGPNNVLDAVSHAHRTRALDGFRRVLRPGGMLIFSSHNLHYRNAVSGPRVNRSRNPVTQLRFLARYAQHVVNYRRIRPLCQFGTEHALLNDEGHGFACLHYYVTHQAQRRQLDEAGFDVLDVLDQDGESIGNADPVHAPYLYYAAVRRDRAPLVSAPALAGALRFPSETEIEDALQELGITQPGAFS